MTPRRPKVPPPLFELEADVMQEVWRQGEVTVRQVLEALNRGKRTRAYTTIMTTMVRLDEKGLLERRREGRTDFYSATMSRDEYLERRAQSEVGALVDRFGDLALAHFARQVERLDPKRLEQLRRLAGRD
jgi:predicted transcriptional regulator